MKMQHSAVKDHCSHLHKATGLLVRVNNKEEVVSTGHACIKLRLQQVDDAGIAELPSQTRPGAYQSNLWGESEEVA